MVTLDCNPTWEVEPKLKVSLITVIWGQPGLHKTLPLHTKTKTNNNQTALRLPEALGKLRHQGTTYNHPGSDGHQIWLFWPMTLEDKALVSCSIQEPPADEEQNLRQTVVEFQSHPLPNKGLPTPNMCRISKMHGVVSAPSGAYVHATRYKQPLLVLPTASDCFQSKKACLIVVYCVRPWLHTPFMYDQAVFGCALPSPWSITGM